MRGFTMLTVNEPHSAEDTGGDPSHNYLVQVLHISVDKIFGGIESSLLTIGRFAPQVPTLVPIFALCFKGRLSKELSEMGVPVHPLGGVRIRSPWTVWRARRRLSKLIEKDRPDIAICHTCWPHALFAPVVRARGVPLAFWAHSKYSGRFWLERWARLTPPDLIVANSVYTRAHVVHQLVPGVPSEVI